MTKKGHLVVSHSLNLLGVMYRQATLNEDFSSLGLIYFEKTKKLRKLFKTSRLMSVWIRKKSEKRGVYIMEVEFLNNSLICEFCFSGDNGVMRDISADFKSDLTSK